MVYLIIGIFDPPFLASLQLKKVIGTLNVVTLVVLLRDLFGDSALPSNFPNVLIPSKFLLLVPSLLL